MIEIRYGIVKKGIEEWGVKSGLNSKKVVCSKKMRFNRTI